MQASERTSQSLGRIGSLHAGPDELKENPAPRCRLPRLEAKDRGCPWSRSPRERSQAIHLRAKTRGSHGAPPLEECPFTRRRTEACGGVDASPRHRLNLDDRGLIIMGSQRELNLG